ncbi:hypothetical protein C0Q70_01238 [Pomacea canaliculata]|uniref:Phospholipase A2 domain-containing protein n=2 Tax=Pomacea canaliculata TaxID=400727 RepID=A0A2T7PYX9_POMCA|nr:hypothetical protein C0Q70_01238 [Pomacea canaliculata]
MKESCDDDFRSCLRRICKRNSNVLKEANDACKSFADGMYAGVMALGCKPYRDSQKQACDCGDSGKIDL